MDVNIVLLLTGGLVALTLLLGGVLRLTQTRVHRRSADHAELVSPEVLAGAGETPQFGSRLTLVQFSTDTCARCPATARSLAAATRAHPGSRHVEIDVSSRDDLITAFSILRTPTVLVLDEDHHLRARVSGPLSPAQAEALVSEHLQQPERSFQ